KMHVPAPAASALRRQKLAARLDQIRDRRFPSKNHRAARNIENQVAAVFSGSFSAAPTFSSGRGIRRFPRKIEQRAQLRIGSKINVAAFPAVSPIGPAFGNKLLPSEGHSSVSAGSSVNRNSGAIDKHGV